ncbi:BnaC02g02650D [Brassica napus]|uniref:BnaC02g02650D protein n=1 Tax=Brassica napus TaxID=3708 RepID=A0A078FP99_BRANA|nr:BnaC02g02650D [Brassica napus]
MVSETWFRNLWKFPKKNEGHKEKDVLGVLAFEVASLLSKLVHLWQSLSDKNVARLRQEITRSAGIKKLVSDDDDFIVRLIRDEMMENVENVAKAVARLAVKCNDPKLKSFEICFGEMMKTGADPYGWQFGWKKMDRKVKRMERFISSNASLYQETEILTELEQSLKRRQSNESATDNIVEYKKKVTWKKHEVKNLREVSLWNRTYDYTVLLLVRSIFTILTRTKHVFGISYRAEASDVSSADSDFIARGHSVSTVLTHQSETTPRHSSAEHHQGSSNTVHVERPKLSDAAPNTLGAACLALHYANVIIVIERFVASPHLIGDDARDDLYNMLPASVRKSLREELKPYLKNLSSSAVYDPGLAKEWTDAMAGILEWLGPLAHNMIKWQSERSYENQSLVSRTHIVLAQTLFFANQQKTETIITELLVGLNYVWRYGRELNAKALQECTSSQTLEKCLDTDN